MKTVPARLLAILSFLILPVISYGQAEESTEAKIRNLPTQFSNHWNSNPEVAYLNIDSLKEIANRTSDLELKATINSYEGIFFLLLDITKRRFKNIMRQSKDLKCLAANEILVKSISISVRFIFNDQLFRIVSDIWK